MPALPATDICNIVDRLAELWHEFRHARFFVTGGTGFIGRWLVEPLLAANDRYGLDAQIILLTRDAVRFQAACPHIVRHSAVSLSEGDIRSFDSPRAPMTHIIHGAANLDPKASPGEIHDGILRGTERIVTMAGSARCLFISSGGVYGIQQTTHVDEQAPCLPQSPYGKAKAAAERLIRVHKGLDYRIARVFALIGPALSLNGSFAAGNFVRDLLANDIIKIAGDGMAQRSYLYAAEMSLWLWTIFAKAEPGAVFNVGSEQEITIRELAEKVANLAQPPLTVSVAAQSVSSLAPDIYIPSTKLAQERLGVSQQIDLDEGLRRLVSWARQTEAEAA